MSRVDFVVDDEVKESAHQYNADDVRISFNGGDSFITLETYEHVVVDVTTVAGEE